MLDGPSPEAACCINVPRTLRGRSNLAQNAGRALHRFSCARGGINAATRGSKGQLAYAAAGVA
eukprot:5416219-Alexandrium_andersonii.AAC.1